MDFERVLTLVVWVGLGGIVTAGFGALIFRHALTGDISTERAFHLWLPVAVCYLVVIAAPGTAFAWLAFAAAVVYLVWATTLEFREERQVARDLVAGEIEKWSNAIHLDDNNAGAHLFLGHALVKQGDFATAASHYGRALELDANNVRELMIFLGNLHRDDAAQIEARLPDLGRIAHAVRDRSSYRPAAVWVESEVVATRSPYQRETYTEVQHVLVDPGSPGAVPEADDDRPAHKELLGYASEEERLADTGTQSRLAELRQLLDVSPDDPYTRLDYARALETACRPHDAAMEFRVVLGALPGNEVAAAALERLAAQEAAEAEEVSPPPEPPQAAA